MSSSVNFEIGQGSTFLRTMTVVDNEKTPLDLTNYTLEGQLRKNYNSDEFIAFDIVKINAVSGRITIGLSDTITDTLIFPKYVYDIELTSGDSTKSRILEGSITVSPNVTR